MNVTQQKFLTAPVSTENLEQSYDIYRNHYAYQHAISMRDDLLSVKHLWKVLINVCDNGIWTFLNLETMWKGEVLDAWVDGLGISNSLLCLLISPHGCCEL